MTRQLLASFLLVMMTALWGGTASGVEKSTDPTIVLLIDTSGSMQRMAHEVRTALSRLIDHMQSGWQVVLVRFDVFSEVLSHTDLSSGERRQALKRQVASLRFTGKKTNFDEGLKGAQAALFQARSASPAAIVIISDGLSDPSQSKETLELTGLTQQLFPPETGYGVYFLQMVPGIIPTPRIPTQHGNVTSMVMSPHNAVAILAVIESRMTVVADAHTVQPTAPAPRPEPPAPEIHIAPVAPHVKPAGIEMAMGRVAGYILASLILLAFGIGIYKGSLSSLLPWRRPEKAVRLQRSGESRTLREFWLGPGEALRIGRGICDYPLPTDSTAFLTRQNQELVISPADSNCDISLSGQRILTQTPIGRRSTIVLDGHLYLDVELA